MLSEAIVSSADITILSRFPAPPNGVKATVTATNLILGYPENKSKDWQFCMNLLRSSEFLDRLHSFEVEKCDPKRLAAAKKLLDRFSRDELKNNCMAVICLYDWIMSIFSEQWEPVDHTYITLLGEDEIPLLIMISDVGFDKYTRRTDTADKPRIRGTAARSVGKKATTSMTLELKASHVAELKSYASPPRRVKDLMSATALLLGYTEQQAKEWNFCTKILGEKSFLDKLKTHDSKSCDPASVALAKTLMAAMTRDGVRKVGFAAVGLFDWNAAVITAAGGED